MSKLILAIFIFAFTITTSVLAASEITPETDNDTRAILQEIFASGQAVSADMVLPRDFVSTHAQLQEIFASGQSGFRRYGLAKKLELRLSSQLTVA